MVIVSPVAFGFTTTLARRAPVGSQAEGPCTDRSRILQDLLSPICLSARSLLRALNTCTFCQAGTSWSTKVRRPKLAHLRKSFRSSLAESRQHLGRGSSGSVSRYLSTFGSRNGKIRSGCKKGTGQKEAAPDIFSLSADRQLRPIQIYMGGTPSSERAAFLSIGRAAGQHLLAAKKSMHSIHESHTYQGTANPIKGCELLRIRRSPKFGRRNPLPPTEDIVKAHREKMHPSFERKAFKALLCQHRATSLEDAREWHRTRKICFAGQNNSWKAGEH